MPFFIVRQDITKMRVDAIVNAANTELREGGGVCGAIFQAAGPARLQAACRQVSPIKTGEAVITPGFDLPAKFVIHAAGPIYHRWKGEQNQKLLRLAYMESLNLALENKCESIAFPLISSGIYGYPKEEALMVALAAIRDFLADHDLEVYLVIFNCSDFVVQSSLMEAVASYIDENYEEAYSDLRRNPVDAERRSMQDSGDIPVSMKSMIDGDGPKHASFRKSIVDQSFPCREASEDQLLDSSFQDLDERIADLDEPFNAALLRLIDAKGKKDAEVYKRANIDRKLFSKIRTGKGYTPGKRTILALAIALELTLDETDDLLKRAGYALSHSQKFDVIVEYFIVTGQYDVFEINEILFKYDQPLLGAG
ncbi:MAG: macro domain-containing protein [Clostridiales bacterium]|nr:macro domain-containing protein [Clostridiales bacterium]